MVEPVQIRRMRWRDTHELFDTQTPILIFLVDTLEDEWSTVPEEMVATLESLQSSARGAVRVFEVDFRAERAFLNLFGTRPSPCVIRRLPDEDMFTVLRAGDSRGLVELIEFCRPAFDWRARFAPPPSATVPPPTHRHA
jgi:hypothetical protein